VSTQAHLFSCWIALLVLCATDAVAESVPNPGSTDPRIRSALYRADEVYRLRGFVGYSIELVFEEGEQFVGQGGGDLDAIGFGSHANHLILKPRFATVGTNLVVFTNRRAYRFDYRVAAERPDPLTDEVIYAVQFVYPPAPAAVRAGPTAAEKVAAELERSKLSRPRNVDYWFCGDRALRPVRASDDGIHTRLSFGTKAELPAVFVRNDDGSESLLNFSVDDGEVVIHRVAGTFVLRRGRLTACVVNKGFTGSGDRLDTGTISPDVRRDSKAPRL
jgi:type IV secretion system protein VirB9